MDSLNGLTQEASAICSKTNGYDYLECSAKTKKDVRDVFKAATTELRFKLNNEREEGMQYILNGLNLFRRTSF